MFWLRNKKIVFSYELLSGGLGNIRLCRGEFIIVDLSFQKLMVNNIDLTLE